MADNQLLNDNNNGDDGVGGDEVIFVYTGGEQQVPLDVERVRIAENVDTILAFAFRDCELLIEVEGHDKIKKIEAYTFAGCSSLRRLSKMTGLIEIEEYAFADCFALSELEFERLEIIGVSAFGGCESFRSVNMPSVRKIGSYAFQDCKITDAVFGRDLERIESHAWLGSIALRHIVIPLTNDLFISNFAFNLCINLSRIDTLAGGIHETISSLHLEVWRNEMENEIDRINQTLPNTPSIERTQAIPEWITRVLGRMEHYTCEHQVLLKEAMTLLELALWKAKLLNEVDEKKCNVDVTKRAKIDAEAARKEHRVTCGASIVIKNVLPFLLLK
jgi:hypothetical protein